jgi:outer membrane murein-binding lipoprotein Lpp
MPLTPEEFNQLATKDDLNQLRFEFQEIKSDIRDILTAVDNLAKKVDNMNSEFAANQSAHDRFETRITALENADL